MASRACLPAERAPGRTVAPLSALRGRRNGAAYRARYLRSGPNLIGRTRIGTRHREADDPLRGHQCPRDQRLSNPSRRSQRQLTVTTEGTSRPPSKSMGLSVERPHQTPTSTELSIHSHQGVSELGGGTGC